MTRQVDTFVNSPSKQQSGRHAQARHQMSWNLISSGVARRGAEWVDSGRARC
jgi:hypothetical protein